VLQNFIDRIRLFFQKEKEPFLQLKEILGFYPHDCKLYKNALMHKSYSNNTHSNNAQDKGNAGNNERLEFLGDAILEAAVSDIIYRKYSDKQEGFLTNLRSKLVKRETLNKLAVQVGLDKLVLHTGRLTSGHNSYINGNALEAFIGAIYMDRGYDYCLRFIKDKLINENINIDNVAVKEQNFKSAIIEWCQKYQFAYEFRITDEKVNNGVPTFTTVLLIENKEVGKGNGYSKKESHQKAAKQAMAKVKKDNAFVNMLVDAKRQRKVH